jgi:hypothetical protein
MGTKDRLEREALVSFLGQTANTMTASANLLPTLPIDPRKNDGSEVVRFCDGSVFAGEYQLTDVTTVYGGGKRSRSVGCVGRKIDGRNIEGLKHTPSKTTPPPSKKRLVQGRWVD